MKYLILLKLNFKIMNKRKLNVAILATIAMIAGINVFNAQKSEMLSDVVLANVEALASNEVVPGYTGPAELYDCPLWLTGDGVFCKSENEHPCSIITCG